MKNFLIVLAVLCGCFVIACVLEYVLNMGGGSGTPGGLSYVVAEWRDYDDSGGTTLDATILKDQLILDMSDAHSSKRITEKGRWSAHAFYCDSHLDAPSEVEVARELKNEDLELDIGRFLPDRPGRITLVKSMRGLKEGYQPPYPVNVPGQTVSYPPPKGLIQPGMLECDLQTLPWRPDKIELAPSLVTVNTTTLSDGRSNRNYFPPYDSIPEGSSVYTYHSDRRDAPKLLVTVYHGRVTQVVGGAEATADLPYNLPPPQPPPPEDTAQREDKSWWSWLFDLLLKK